MEEKPTVNIVSDNVTSIESQSDAEVAAESSEPIISTREDISLSVETSDLRNDTDTVFVIWSEVEQLTLEEALSESD